MDCREYVEQLSWPVLKPVALTNPERAKGDFRDSLLRWFRREGKDYPWRRTRDAYAILVSEVMLQQTRLAVVLEKGYYERFMRCFPDPAVLAAATEEDLLRVWEGLGYYRRARMLQAAARIVTNDFGGVFPADPAQLLRLPGIGKYTAGAVLSFAFNQPAALVDGNVLRVFSRLFDDATPVDSAAGIKAAWRRAETLLDQQHPRLYNSALMELGQRICKVGAPDCGSCPVATCCRTRHPEQLPVKDKTTKITELEEQVIFAVNDRNEILLVYETGRRRAGLWRLPERTSGSMTSANPLLEITYGITRYRVRLRVCAAKKPELLPGETWVSLERIDTLPIAAPYRKVLRLLLP